MEDIFLFLRGRHDAASHHAEKLEAALLMLVGFVFAFGDQVRISDNPRYVWNRVWFKSRATEKAYALVRDKNNQPNVIQLREDDENGRLVKTFDNRTLASEALDTFRKL